MIIKASKLKIRLTRLMQGKVDPTLPSDKNEACLKPEGIWLSVNNSWEDWCRNENFGCQDRTQWDAKIWSRARIFVINNKKDFLEFAHVLGIMNCLHAEHDVLRIHWTIENADKICVALDYAKTLSRLPFDGVYLTDTGQALTRYSTPLYGWDCASIIMFNPQDVIFLNPRAWFKIEKNIKP